MQLPHGMWKLTKFGQRIKAGDILFERSINLNKKGKITISQNKPRTSIFLITIILQDPFTNFPTAYGTPLSEIVSALQRRNVSTN